MSDAHVDDPVGPDDNSPPTPVPSEPITYPHVVQETTNVTIEQLTEAVYDENGEVVTPATYRRTYHARPLDPNTEIVIEGDPVAQRILDKVADFRQTANQADNVTVTQQNAINVLQQVVNEFADLLRAVAWLGERHVHD